jgi:hypothetical protein
MINHLKSSIGRLIQMKINSILKDYKFVLLLQDSTRVYCLAMSIDTLAGLIYTSNPDNLKIRITDVSMILLQGEL